MTFSITSIAKSDDQVIRLDKGTPAPYSGVLMPNSVALDLRNAVVDRDGYKLINDSLTRSLDFYKSDQKISADEVNILTTRNTDLATTLKSSQDSLDTTRVIWFVLGIAVTGLAVYGVKNISNK